MSSEFKPPRDFNRYGDIFISTYDGDQLFYTGMDWRPTEYYERWSTPQWTIGVTQTQAESEHLRQLNREIAQKKEKVKFLEYDRAWKSEALALKILQELGYDVTITKRQKGNEA